MMEASAKSITASMLYNLVSCPHRVTMDAFADPSERDEISPFIQLLWERGYLFEQETMAGVGVPFLDLSGFAGNEKESLTTEAMARREPLIYSGRMSAGDLLGDPDLLRLDGDRYIAGDIKSGAGEEGPEDLSKPKLHYAVQLALYTGILEQKRLSAGRRAFIWDIHGEEVAYDFDTPLGVKNPTTLWREYQAALADARQIVARATDTLPAYSSICKQCWWYSACQRRLEELDDLTLLPDLGRSKRDVMADRIPTVQALAEIDTAGFVTGKKTIFPGIGRATLIKLHDRAKLVKSASPKPYLTEPLDLPHAELEVFFDIEVDPMRDFCYLHGFIERHGGDNSTERYAAYFTADLSEDGEQEAFAAAWRYLSERPRAVIYYYSKYERTIWRKLREKYPEVCSEDELEALFQAPRSIDIYYDVVTKKTEWPTRDHSIKTLAKHLGFSWRDTHPSGAASIEWFHRWVEAGDVGIQKRILDYNEDDCRATRVLLDGLREL